MGFPCSSVGKKSACSAGDPSSIPGLGRSPGEGNATHSSVLALKISWTQEPGGLQSMGSQRVGHDWVTNTYFNRYYPGVLEEIIESLQTEKVIKIFEQTLISSETRYQNKN